MKTSIIFLSALFILSNSVSNAQQSVAKKTNVESFGFKGKVKQVNQSKYAAKVQGDKIVQGDRVGPDRENYLLKYDEEGNNIAEFTYNLDGSLYSSIVCKYDSLGNQIAMNGFNSQNEESSKNYKIIWKYDEIGNMIETVNYKSDGSVYKKCNYKYKYDENGNKTKTEENTGDINGYFVNVYDNKGNQIEFSQHNANGSLRIKYTFKYDDKGNEIEINKYNSFETLVEKEVNKYDDSGNIIEWNTYTANGKLKNNDVRKYDDRGNIVEENFYKGNGKLIDTHTSQFEYDRQGNWIKKVKFKDGEPTNVYIRQFEYYN